MKQVVGSPFTGLSNAQLENDIIDGLISASRRSFDDPGLNASDREEYLKRLLNPLIDKLKALISSEVSIYLKTIVTRLLDPGTSLRWSATSNNCQNFCDSLLDWDTFGPLVAERLAGDSEDAPRNPLYIMSFLCRPAGYIRGQMKSKFDVPNGLTEEYLLKFRYGRHDEADIVDTLEEYWYDWGGFGKPLYKYQDLFPWDCTEAYGRYPVTCGDCNLAKHVWAFPFDSWSIISLHLARDKYLYPPTDPKDPKILSEEDWMRNRLTILLAQEALTSAAVAMAKIPAFKKATAWLHMPEEPGVDRLKLGGIHRAQPFSHFFDQGKYHHYFIAEWAHLNRKDQVAAYELLRDGRVKQPDVLYGRFNPSLTGTPWLDGGLGSGVDAQFADAGFMDSFAFDSICGSSSCAGACAGNCGSGCGAAGCGGSGCAGGSGCGGGGGGCGGGGGGCGGGGGGA
jgi:uncharacterized membrane protein YgcG